MRTSPTVLRHCPQCLAEVEATGGYCLLGHKLALSAATDMSQLRAEVDRVFEEARREITSAAPQTGASSVPPPPPPPPPARAGEARPARTHQPNAPQAARREKRSIWAALEAQPTPVDDPITAFAPAPRMDWGPQRDLPRLRLFRRSSRASG